MAEERDMSGILFTNDKQGNEKRPDWTGRLKVDGRVYRLSAWQKQGKKGPFLSLAVSVPQARTPEPQSAPGPQAAPDPPVPGPDDAPPPWA